MAKVETFDLEALSAAIGARARITSAERSDEFDAGRDATTLPIDIDNLPLASIDESAELMDAVLQTKIPCFADDHGRFWLYRIAVLGIGTTVDRLHGQLKARLGSERETLRSDFGLGLRFNVALFGGEIRGKAVSAEDAAYLGDKLAIFRPNLLVLVNAGQVEERFAHRTPQQLAILTRYINNGATTAEQRPYALVMVVDQPIDPASFETYGNACDALKTPPALLQFQVDEVQRVAAYARFEATRFAEDHLLLRESEEAPAPLDLDLELDLDSP